MKIEVTKELRSFTGLPFKARKLVPGETPDDVPNMTLRDVMIAALTNDYEGEKIDGTARFKNYLLAEKVHKADAVDLSAEEVSDLKRRAGKLFPTMTVGAFYQAIDPASSATDE